jgi:S-DNA-T family DNA segregation ATPase FtsK/SpoIIIE
VSLLQRRLAIGYTRASRLIDLMGIAGIISEHKGSVARDVLIGAEEWAAMKQLAADEARAKGVNVPSLGVGEEQGDLFASDAAAEEAQDAGDAEAEDSDESEVVDEIDEEADDEMGEEAGDEIGEEIEDASEASDDEPSDEVEEDHAPEEAPWADDKPSRSPKR